MKGMKAPRHPERGIAESKDPMKKAGNSVYDQEEILRLGYASLRMTGWRHSFISFISFIYL